MTKTCKACKSTFEVEIIVNRKLNKFFRTIGDIKNWNGRMCPACALQDQRRRHGITPDKFKIEPRRTS